MAVAAAFEREIMISREMIRPIQPAADPKNRTGSIDNANRLPPVGRSLKSEPGSGLLDSLGSI